MRSRYLLLAFVLLVVAAGLFVWWRKTELLPAAGDAFNLSAVLPQSAGSFSTASGVGSTSESVPTVDPMFLVSDDDPFLGNPAAPLTIVEFIDFQCPFCRQSFPIMRRLLARYENDVFYQVRDFPLPSIHAEASSMAVAGVCAHEQGKFWELHDRMFLEQERASLEQINVWAQKAGLNMNAFQTCRVRADVQQEITVDVELGQVAGVRGTPTFFINGQKIEGVVSEEALERVIQAFQAQQ